MLSAAFPSPGIAGLAWVGPGLILFAALGTKGKQAFRIGFVGGLIHFLSSLSWLLNIPYAWHGIPIAPGAGWIALSAYCALFPAVWVWLCWKIFPAESADQFLSGSNLRRVGWELAAGMIWTGLEYGRGRILTGFPWNFVGASQYKMSPLIQFASIAGIYGVSFLVVWTSVALGSAVLALVRKPSGFKMWAEMGLPLLVVAGLTAYGSSKLTVSKPARTLKVAMIQPSIPQTLIWDPKENAARFQTVLDLSEEAMASKPELLLWPESAVPDLDLETQEAIGRLIHRHTAWLAFCADSAVQMPGDKVEYFNSSFFFNPLGVNEGVYHKRRLVIFGEYIPLHWIPFLKWLTPIGGEYTPGDRPVEFVMDHPSVKMSVLICFEDMFAQEAREHVTADTEFLVNLTNDGWFGHASEQWQQAASAIFRAIENGVPLLRCTNDGLTCWADAQGRLRQIFSAKGSVYGAGYMIADIPLRGAGDRQQTFYNRHGDWFAVGCCGMGVVLLAARFRRREATA